MTNGRATGISEEKDREMGQEEDEEREEATMKIVRSWRLSTEPSWKPMFGRSPPPDRLLRLPDTASVKFEYRIVLVDTIFTTCEFSTTTSRRIQLICIQIARLQPLAPWNVVNPNIVLTHMYEFIYYVKILS